MPLNHDPSQIIAPDSVLAGDDYPAGQSSSGQGTMFPALRGGDPGENDPGQNLGDYPFGAPLHGEDSMPLSTIAQSGVVSPAEVQAAGEQLPDPNMQILEGIAAPGVGGPPTSTRKRSAEERISQLTARWRAEQNTNSELTNQLAQLTQVVQSMQAQQFSQPQVPRPNYGSGEASPSDNPLANFGQQNAQVPNATDLRRIVQESVAPLAETVTGLIHANQLRQAQEVSFARAVEDFPEIGRPGTEAQNLFRRIMLEHGGIAGLPDAPEQAAVFVRGVLAGSRRDSQVAGQRKLQAGIQVPTPSPSDEISIGPSQAAQVKALRDQAAQNTRLGDRSFETYKALRLAGRAQGQPRR